MTEALKDTPKNTPEEKNELREKASEIVGKIMLKPSMLYSPTNNIFMPENAELKNKLIAELESMVTIDIQEKVKKTLTRPILFVGDVYKAMLAGCYAHCVRKVEFVANRIPKRLEEAWIEYGGDIDELEEIKLLKQVCEMFSEAEGRFIYKDCFGQPIEKIWYADDPAYYYVTPNQPTGIKNWLQNYHIGATLFLVGLEGEDSNECKEFVKNIRDPKPAIPNKLIVHTNDINKLPKYFTKQFEVIELEAEKQDTAQEAIELKYDKDKHTLFTNEIYLRLTGDKKILIQCLSEGSKHIDILVDKIAQSKGKNTKQYNESNCRKLITETNKVIENEFSIKDFILNEKNKSGFYCLKPKPKDGIFQR